MKAPLYVIKSNYRVRDLIAWVDLPETAQKEFDYVENDDRLVPRFVKYRNEWIDAHDVIRAPDSIRALGWDGFNSDSHWSGIVFRYFDKDGYEFENGVVLGYLVIQEG